MQGLVFRDLQVDEIDQSIQVLDALMSKLDGGSFMPIINAVSSISIPLPRSLFSRGKTSTLHSSYRLSRALSSTLELVVQALVIA